MPYCPIIVYQKDDKFKIVDGQHRFETCQRIKAEVHFVECEPLTLKQIARINSRSNKWSNKDFLDCYVRLEVQDYILLRDFIAKYHVVYSAAVDLLMHGKINSKGGSMDIFRDGEFQANNLEEAERITGLTIDIFDRYKFRSDRYLIAAMQEIDKVGKCDYDVLRTKINQAPMMMDKQPSWKEYVYNIERVYNHNNQKRIVIF